MFTLLFRALGNICLKRRASRNQSCSYILWEAGPKMMDVPLSVACSNIRLF
jgi:hypothetical protein